MAVDILQGIQGENMQLHEKLIVEYSENYATHPLPFNFGDPVPSPAGWLLPAANPNTPDRQLVGAIQADSPTAAQYLFADDLVTCKQSAGSLRCRQLDSALASLATKKNAKLPSVRGQHHMYLDSAGILRSHLLRSSGDALQIGIRLQHYNLTVLVTEVCPEISDKYSTVGCFGCAIPAKLTISARSMCKPGTVVVTYENVTLLTASIFLTTKFKTFSHGFSLRTHSSLLNQLTLSSMFDATILFGKSSEPVGTPQ
jgi:hypothetical protein